jgi:2-C-methyl-D-erythritol 4-phosphate cytidylyltransferase
LLAAHRKAAAEGFETTDDAAILEYAGHPVSIVFGSRYNLKITNPEDLLISEAIAPIALGQQTSDLRGT